MKRAKKNETPKKYRGKARPVQFASTRQIAALELDDVTPIARFLEDFRQLVDPRAQHKSKLISVKIPEPLLAAFKYKASLEDIPYQTMIKILMTNWLKENS
jgi:predicted DNA binding CopG/RHH family protein